MIIEIPPELRPDFMRLESQRAERKKKWHECVLAAYDVTAQNLLDYANQLDDWILEEYVPGIVFEVAREFGWIENPDIRSGMRTVKRYNAWFGTPTQRSEFYSEAVPESERTSKIGNSYVRPSVQEWWLQLLKGRILHWKAEAIVQAQQAPRFLALESKKVSRKPTESERKRRAKVRGAFVLPLLAAKKPEGWTPNHWAVHAELPNPHPAYRYLEGDNISAESRQKLGKALGHELPE